jgi:methylenetetrahydrofolate reductase (NADPH)
LKIIELYKSGKPLLSLEVFPPQIDYPLETVFKTLDGLKLLKPGYISVTYGAGGSNRARTVEIAARIKKEYGIESQAHLTCTGHTNRQIEIVLNELSEQGVENIMALRGDPPQDGTIYNFSKQEYCYALDMIKDIKKNKTNFGISAAAHPEGHPECDRLKEDIFNLKKKVDTGVDFLITQLFFDNRIYYEFVDRAIKSGIKCPIVPGIMPVLNARQIRRIIYLCGASIPAKLLILVDKYDNNPEGMAKAGVEYASQQVEDLLNNKVPGIHLYTMNRSKQITDIVKNVGLA